MNALFDETLADLFSDVDGPIYMQIETSRIIPDPSQPRKVFEQTKLNDLAQSMLEEGQIQAIEVTETDDGVYMISVGERRWRAAQIANIEKLDAKVFNVDKNRRKLRQLIENLHKDDMTSIDIANGIKDVVNIFNGNSAKAAKALGFSEGQVSKYLSILNLPEFTQSLAKTKVTKDVEVLTTLASIERKNPKVAEQIIETAKTNGNISRDKIRAASRTINNTQKPSVVKAIDIEEKISKDQDIEDVDFLEFCTRIKANDLAWIEQNSAIVLQFVKLLLNDRQLKA